MGHAQHKEKSNQSEQHADDDVHLVHCEREFIVKLFLGVYKVLVAVVQQALFALLPGILDVNFQRTFEPGTVDVLLEVRRGTDLRRDIWALAAKAQLPILEMRPISVSLEDVFLQLTGSGGGGL